MTALYDPARHVAPAATWDEARARDAIAALCRAAGAGFDGERWWPVHELDWDATTPERAGGLYLGAAGMVHALDRLRPFHDTPCYATILDPAVGDELTPEDGLLIGAAGVLLVRHRLTGDGADDLAAVIERHLASPSDELLEGTAGTLLAARVMHERTGDERFAALARRSEEKILARRDADGLWLEDGLRYLGPAHGAAGILLATRQKGQSPLSRWAIVEDGLVNWPALDVGSRSGQAPRVQWCHGAPGMIISGVVDDDLLEGAGELVWRAGPSALGAGLCHGTAGNGFAFLALFAQTQDERWLERARVFAAHALAQAGGDRFGLYTGDIGAALLAAACITPDPRFPGLGDL